MTAEPWSEDFLVNTIKAGIQEEPSVVGLSDGRFVVVWKDGSKSKDDKSGSAVRGQIFNADGSKAGDEFLVNTTKADSQQKPYVTALAAGKFVVVWTDFSTAGEGDGIDVRGQVFKADGTKSGSEFIVKAAGSEQDNPSITALDDGTAVASWVDSGRNAFARIFNPDGSEAVAEFALNAGFAGFVSAASVAALEGGGFVVAMQVDQGGDVEGTSIYYRKFDADGNGGTEVRVNEDIQAGHQSDPAVAGLPGGGFVVTWADQNGDGDGIGIRARIFDENGAEVAEFPVNGTTEGDQHLPAVAALADGRFVVIWQDLFDGNAIKGRVFEAGGDPADDEFEITDGAVVDGTALAASISVLADGRFVVSWAYQSDLDGDSKGVRAQIFDAREEAIELEGTSRPDQFYGTEFADTLGGAGDSDKLNGADGDDLIRGGSGKDRVDGGDGAGDIVDFSDQSKAVVLTLKGGNTATAEIGGKAADKVKNVEGIIGGTGKDKLTGDGSDNTLNGGAGKDTLRGKGGADTFVFGSGDATDSITDFATGEDKIALSLSAFQPGGLVEGPLNSENFVIGIPFENDQFFSFVNGTLTFDSNGSDAGGTIVNIVTLQVGATLFTGDIELVA